MEIILPGTMLQFPQREFFRAEDRIRAMFLAGDISLSQVSAVTGLEPYMIQNWVKRGFLTPPARKRYSLGQLCRIITINMLRAALPMEDICNLLSYVNGQLDDESDDLIDDAQLYFLFIRLADGHHQLADPTQRESFVEEVLADYREPVPGAGTRVRKVLNVMLTAWAAAQLRQTAQRLMGDIKYIKE